MSLDAATKKRLKAAEPSGKYAVHPGVGMVQKWVAELEAKTGWDLDGWYRQIKKHAPLDEKGRREWLKAEHGLGTNTAWWLVESMEDRETWDAEPLSPSTHVFAQLKPTTRTRIDLALALGPDVPFTDRLLDTGGLKKKDRLTHRIGITSLEEIDDEVVHWLRAAYGAGGATKRKAVAKKAGVKKAAAKKSGAK